MQRELCFSWPCKSIMPRLAVNRIPLHACLPAEVLQPRVAHVSIGLQLTLTPQFPSPILWYSFYLFRMSPKCKEPPGQKRPAEVRQLKLHKSLLASRWIPRPRPCPCLQGTAFQQGASQCMPPAALSQHPAVKMNAMVIESCSCRSHAAASFRFISAGCQPMHVHCFLEHDSC